MKNKILEITKQLENDKINFREARLNLCELFGIKYKQHFIGSAMVKKDTKWKYAGMKLPIIDLYAIHENGIREFKLSIKNTEWGEEQEYTVMPEIDLEFIELIEI